jgi:hypothetical protein
MRSGAGRKAMKKLLNPLILALILIAQGVDAIEVGLIQESGQMQSTYVYNNSALCSPPPDCGSSGGVDEAYYYSCDSSFLDKIKIFTSDCYEGFGCFYKYNDKWLFCPEGGSASFHAI